MGHIRSEIGAIRSDFDDRLASSAGKIAFVGRGRLLKRASPDCGKSAEYQQSRNDEFPNDEGSFILREFVIRRGVSLRTSPRTAPGTSMAVGVRIRWKGHRHNCALDFHRTQCIDDRLGEALPALRAARGPVLVVATRNRLTSLHFTHHFPASRALLQMRFDPSFQFDGKGTGEHRRHLFLNFMACDAAKVTLLWTRPPPGAPDTHANSKKDHQHSDAGSNRNQPTPRSFCPMRKRDEVSSVAGLPLLMFIRWSVQFRLTSSPDGRDSPSRAKRNHRSSSSFVDSREFLCERANIRGIILALFPREVGPAWLDPVAVPAQKAAPAGSPRRSQPNASNPESRAAAWLP